MIYTVIARGKPDFDEENNVFHFRKTHLWRIENGKVWFDDGDNWHDFMAELGVWCEDFKGWILDHQYHTYQIDLNEEDNNEENVEKDSYGTWKFIRDTGGLKILDREEFKKWLCEVTRPK